MKCRCIEFIITCFSILVHQYCKRSILKVQKVCGFFAQCLLIRMSPFLNKPKTLFFFFQLSGQRHRCFVCAPNTRKYADFQELKKMFGDTKIPKCSHYHNSRRHDFIQECPKDSKGCLTQFEGDNTYKQIS